MTAKDPTARGVVVHQEIRLPPAGDIMLPVPVVGRGVQVALVLEEAADTEEITAADEVTMAINQADLPPTMIATPRAEIVTGQAAVEGEGGTIPVPLPRAQVAIPPPRGLVDILHPVCHRAAPMAVDPLGNIQILLAEVTAALITTVGDPAPVPASPDQSQPLMTVMDHRLVVVVVVVLVVVAAVAVPMAADHLIAVETLGRTDLPRMLTEVAVDMTRVQGTAEAAAQCMGVVNLLRGALDRPLPVGPLVDIRRGVPHPRLAISPLPRVQGAAIIPAAELVVVPVQLAELAGDPLLVTN